MYETTWIRPPLIAACVYSEYGCSFRSDVVTLGRTSDLDCKKTSKLKGNAAILSGSSDEYGLDVACHRVVLGCLGIDIVPDAG